MPPSNAMENDKKRLRNQFTKDERTRLLGIMTEYGPLLDDKNISILSRKEIWEIIENKFNENGHSGRTSAQLKKYWQNYKYHSKRTKIIHKDVPKPLSPMTKHMVRMLAKVNPEDWAHYNIAENSVAIKKSPASSRASPTLVNCGSPAASSRRNAKIGQRDRGAESSSQMTKILTTPPKRSSKSTVAAASDSRLRPENSSIRTAGTKNEISESNVVVSTTDVPGSSVTVSVICPEVSSNARTIFWQRNMPQEKVGSMSQSNDLNERERVVDDFGSEVENSDVCSQETDNMESGKLIRQKSYGNRIGIVGILPGNKSERSGIDRVDHSNRKTGGYRRFAGVDDRPVHQSMVVSSQKVCDNQSQTNMKAGATGIANQCELIGNVIGVVKEMPTGKARLLKDCNSMERLGSISMTNGRDEKRNIPTGGSILNPFSSGQMISQENRATDHTSAEKEDVDYSELNELLKEFAAVNEGSKRTEIPDEAKEMMETFNKVGSDQHFRRNFIESLNEKREMELTRYMIADRNKESSTQDFLWLKLYLKLLRSVRQAGGKRRLEILRKFEPPVPETSSNDKRSQNDEENSDCSYPAESEQGMEVDEDTNPENGTGKLRVRRVSLMASAVGENQVQRGIKIETEIEPEDGDIAQNPVNDNTEDDRVMNSMNYLVQAKLQYAKSELDHQLKLQKLEMEEKELRVRIAEMTIQETRLRIQALVEERLRAIELHELRVAQIAVEKVRSEAEHAAQIDASCIATAEGRARISSIERDRERSENFYQMQLRCMSTTNANGQCGVKCKQYQQ